MGYVFGFLLFFHITGYEYRCFCPYHIVFQSFLRFFEIGEYFFEHLFDF